MLGSRYKCLALWDIRSRQQGIVFYGGGSCARGWHTTNGEIVKRGGIPSQKCSISTPTFVVLLKNLVIFPKLLKVAFFNRVEIEEVSFPG